MTVRKLVDKYPYPAADRSRYPLATKYGVVSVAAIRAGEIHVTGGIPHNTPDGEATALTLRGVAYSIQAHARLDAATGRYALIGEDRYRFLSRRDWLASGKSDVSRSACDAIRPEVEDRVTEWANLNASALADAETRDRAIGAHTLARQIDAATATLALLQENLAACVAGEPYTLYPETGR